MIKKYVAPTRQVVEVFNYGKLVETFLLEKPSVKISDAKRDPRQRKPSIRPDMSQPWVLRRKNKDGTQSDQGFGTREAARDYRKGFNVDGRIYDNRGNV